MWPPEVSYVPPAAQRLTISRCQQFSRVDCRQFPRESVDINLSYNQCRGSLDLSVLPAKLQFLDLMQNQLTGPIGLFHLPETLKKLNLGRNRIEQDAVYYGELPSAIEGIYLFDNAAGPIKPANDSVREVDPRIFNASRDIDLIHLFIDPLTVKCNELIDDPRLRKR